MGNIYDHNKTHGKKGPPRWYCRYADIDGIRKNRPTHQAAYADAMRFLRVVEDRVARGLPGIPEGDDPSFREELIAALGNPKLPRPRPSPPPPQAMLARRPSSPAPAPWGIAPPPPSPTSSLQASAEPQPEAIGELIDLWMASLRNRNAEGDRKIAAKYLRPTFGGMTFADINLAALMRWIDQQRATGAISDATIRRNMNLLSRFFGWAVDRGYTTTNPVRLIPPGKRPRQSGKADAPWIEDDAPVRRVIAKLPEPINLMFYLGNRSGLRTGEIAGLRMSDLGFLGEGVIRARYSYNGPLK